MNIRLANKNDAAVLVAIYAPYVEKSMMFRRWRNFLVGLRRPWKGILIWWLKKRESFWVMLMLRLIMVERHTTGLLNYRSM